MRVFKKCTSIVLMLILILQCLNLSYFAQSVFAETGTDTSIKVQLYNADKNGFTNTISPRFKIVNTGTQPVKLSDIKVRYYFTVDDEKQQSFSCDYSTVGNSNVTGAFVKMPEHLTTADYYLELGFNSSGTIAPNGSAEVYCRINRIDNTPYNQQNDFSFDSNDTNYADFDNVAAYIGNNLVWGNEASGDILLYSISARVQAYNTNTSAQCNTLSPRFKIQNTGTEPINLKELKLRYFYTPENDKKQQFFCDYSNIGSSKVTGTFAKTPDTSYCELGFTSDAGVINPGNVIEVHTRIANGDWSNYNQADDYSFNSTAITYVDTDKVAILINGCLIAGSSPNIIDMILDPSVLTLKLGETSKIDAVFDKRNEASTPIIQWTSSDPSVATVDQNGSISGVADGMARISAVEKASGLTADCIVTVNNTGIDPDEESDSGSLSLGCRDEMFGIILDWSDLKGERTYTIKRSADSGEYVEIASGVTGTRYLDENVEASKQYSYKVCADSEESNAATVKHLKEDSDNDGLPDAYESIAGTDMYNPDTDNNGVPDGKEDYDKDGLTNEEEEALGTDLYNKDSDGDGLPDVAELNIYGTDPAKNDTDSDGLSDGDELRLRTNPLNKDTDGDGVPDGDEKFNQTISKDIQPGSWPIPPALKNVSINLTCTGDTDNTTVVESVYGTDAVSSDVQGLVGYPVSIESSSKFDSAKVKFTYDENLLNGTSEDDLGILWYDEENDSFVYLPSTVDKVNNTVTFETTHFSKYMLVDLKKWFDTWRNRISYRNTSTEIKYYDVVLSIDSSGSMLDSDPNNLRKTAAKSFVDAFLPGDKGAVVDFDDYATVLIHLTQDKDGIKAAIDKINSSGGTDIGIAVSTSINELISENATVKNSKAIILLTDGQGYYNESLTQIAAASNIKIYTIGLGNYVDESLLKSIADGTGGKYYQLTSSLQLAEAFERISNETVDEIDPTDSDNDGMPDIVERKGIRLSNGNIIYSDPSNPDTDGNGILDGKEGLIVRDTINSNDGSSIKRVYLKVVKAKTDPEWVLQVSPSNNKNDVIVLQKTLVAKGYLVMPIDPNTKKPVAYGEYGSITQTAVTNFQKNNRLNPNGVVKSDTWIALGLPWDSKNKHPDRTNSKYTNLLYSNGLDKAQIKKVSKKLNDLITENDIKAAKSNLEKLMQHALDNGFVLKKINLRNEDGILDSKWGPEDGPFKQALRDYLEKKQLKTAYSAFNKSDRYFVEFYWLKMQAEGKSLLSNPAPVEWYEKWKLPPITKDEKTKAKYYNKYIFPTDRVMHFSTPYLTMYEVWKDNTYGLDGIEKFWHKLDGYLNVGVAFCSGIALGVGKALEGTATAIAHPIRTYEGIVFLWRALHPEEYPKENKLYYSMMVQAIIGWGDDFANGNIEQRASMLGEIVGQILIAVAGSKGVDSVLEAVQISSKTGLLAKLFSNVHKGETATDVIGESLVAITEIKSNLPQYLSGLKTKPQVVINKEVGTAFENYVEGTKLAHVDYDIQDLYGIIDKQTGQLVQVKPDFTIKSHATQEKVAFADAKTALTGEIANDEQFKRLVWLTADETTTKTLIYYVPDAGEYVSYNMTSFAARYGVKVLEVVAQ